MTLEEQAATLDRDSIVDLLKSNQALNDSLEELSCEKDSIASQQEELSTEVERLRLHVAWLHRQLYGRKSERRIIDPNDKQLTLGEWLREDAPEKEEVVVVPEHSRRKKRKKGAGADGEGLRFDDSVPVEEIRLPNPEVDEADETQEITEKITYRLAQRPGAFVVLKYIRPVVKKKDGTLTCPPAPPSVLGKSIADVSLLAGLVIDKFRYHMPLYRQHQRMKASGVHLARSTLTGLVHRTAELLQPIYAAQLKSILTSDVLTMDETPIKAGRKGHGKMKAGYFWPVYGDKNEIAFPFAPSRAGAVVRKVLGEYCGVLVTDGYKVYETYAGQINGLVHAQCWSHTRREFLKAEGAEPAYAAKALDSIRKLYEIETKLGKRNLLDGGKIELRTEFCRPIVEKFFGWLKRILAEQALLPSNPFTKAARYALYREKSLRVFLEYPNVPIDTNHLEREIRPIALGRKNWMFCWTEIGADYVGVFQSLLSTCKLQGIDPYTYLVDVLQRIDSHLASKVDLLTPRLWKENYAERPMKSDLDRDIKNAES